MFDLVEQPCPLLPPGGEDVARWAWTNQAYRLLYGCWEQDLRDRVLEHLGDVRADAIGKVDKSANMYRQSWDAVAKLYDMPPIVDHPGQAGKALAALVAASGWWSLAQRVQRDTLGYREVPVHVRVVNGAPLYRPVRPSRVVARPNPDRPNQPIEVWEAVELPDSMRGGQVNWFWAHYDGVLGTYRVLDAHGEDATARTGQVPYTFPRGLDGKPILPWVWYHAAETGHLWDWRTNVELVDGTLNTATYYTMFGHSYRSAAWAQRWAANARPAGGEASGVDGAERRTVVADPSTVVLLEAVDDAQPIQVGQWQAPTDPMVMITAVERYARQHVEAATGGSAETSRMTGDPRSGYALSVSRDTQREVQRRLEPVFLASDLQLLAVTAALLGPQYPQSGYRIAYRGIPLSAGEREAERKHVTELLDKGLISKATAYRMLHPGATEAEADAEIERAAEDTAPAEVAGVEGGGAVQDTALNGAQVASLVDIVVKVASKELPRDAATAIIARAFAVDATQANALLGSAGESFVIDPPAAPAPFGGGPPRPAAPPDETDPEEEAPDAE